MRPAHALPLLLSLCLLTLCLPSAGCGESEFARAQQWSARVASALDAAATIEGVPAEVAQIAKAARAFDDEFRQLSASDFPSKRAALVALFRPFSAAVTSFVEAGALRLPGAAGDLAAVLARLVPRLEKFLGGESSRLDLEGDVRALELSAGR